jgi:hypothetical protein
MKPIFFVLAIILIIPTLALSQQKDSLIVKDTTGKVVAGSKVKKGFWRDSTGKRTYEPRKAAIYSALVPGLGQIYNKKYWKLPIVYGALGTCGVIFAYNLNNYRDTRFAYRVKYNMRVNRTDSTLYPSIRQNLKPLSEESLRNYRNQFRKDIDYSVLVFILLWGLNVVDATVDAHLKTFDVSPDLSFRLRPGYSEMARTNGISLVMQIGK